MLKTCQILKIQVILKKGAKALPHSTFSDTFTAKNNKSGPGGLFETLVSKLMEVVLECDGFERPSVECHIMLG